MARLGGRAALCREHGRDSWRDGPFAYQVSAAFSPDGREAEVTRLEGGTADQASLRARTGRMGFVAECLALDGATFGLDDNRHASHRRAIGGARRRAMARFPVRRGI